MKDEYRVLGIFAAAHIYAYGGIRACTSFRAMRVSVIRHDRDTYYHSVLTSRCWGGGGRQTKKLRCLSTRPAALASMRTILYYIGAAAVYLHVDRSRRPPVWRTGEGSSSHHTYPPVPVVFFSFFFSFARIHRRARARKEKKGGNPPPPPSSPPARGACSTGACM